MSAFELLHPALQYHVVNTLGWATLRPTQLEAIEPILGGKHCLCLAPTAGGKTEAAAIPILSRMLQESWPGVSVLYVCPIKALLNNLEHRLSHYAGLVGRRVAVWHGDVSSSQKQRSLREPPDILLTTPESLEGMLISKRVNKNACFGQLRAVIVDELHAFAGDDRGWHLKGVLSRLERYTTQPVQRIGLSATVFNPEELLAWFAPEADRKVVGSSSVTGDADVTIDYVGSLANAATVIGRLHRGSKRLVFCDSRSNAESLASCLRSMDVRTFVSHASLSRSERKLAEAAFAEERDCVIVATSTLELGIDVGDLDYVIQIDSPGTVSSFLQRMGRTGRRPGSRRNYLFLCTSDSALQLAMGICQKWTDGWVEPVVAPPEPWPLIAQQAIATTLELGQLSPQELLRSLGRAFPQAEFRDIKVLLEHLEQKQYLVSADGLLQVGPETEKKYGRGHYKDLLASFSGTQMLTGRHGAAEVGYIDPMSLANSERVHIILLGGRSWKVGDIDWSRKIAWLEPVKEGGHARWTGSARSLSFEICQAIRQSLAMSDFGPIRLSKRAILEIEQVKQDLPDISADSALTISVAPNGIYRVWTFGGARANRVLMKLYSPSTRITKVNELSFDVGGERATPDASSLSQLAANFVTDGDMEAHSEATKFAECVPVELLRRHAAARLFDQDAATKLLMGPDC